MTDFVPFEGQWDTFSTINTFDTVDPLLSVGSMCT